MDFVGFIGTGIMGKPISKNLIKSCYKLIVFDINPKQLKELSRKPFEP